jgi:hypothetical protein
LKGDRSAGEHDEGEGCFGAVEAAGAADDQADGAVGAFGAAVVDTGTDRGEYPVAELTDRLGGLDERGQAGFARFGQPPVEQFGDRVSVEVAGEGSNTG